MHTVDLSCTLLIGDGKEAEGRIIGGVDAQVGSLPYHVGLSCSNFKNDAYCGGALLTPSFVVTGDYNTFIIQ